MIDYPTRIIPPPLPACVIEVGHPAGTPATWANKDHPEHTVCDRHKHQYETSPDSHDIRWRRLA